MCGIVVCLPASALTLDLQDEMAQTLDEFKEKFTEEPKREDLSLLWPHSDDPSDQVRLQQCSTAPKFLMQHPSFWWPGQGLPSLLAV